MLAVASGTVMARGKPTDRFASRYIILSLRCPLGVMVSPERAGAGCDGLGVLTTPLVFWFAERCVMGLVPCHALGCEGFLEGGLESAACLRAGYRDWHGETEGCNGEEDGGGARVYYVRDESVAPWLHVTDCTSHEKAPLDAVVDQRALEAWLGRRHDGRVRGCKGARKRRKLAGRDGVVGGSQGSLLLRSINGTGSLLAHGVLASGGGGHLQLCSGSGGIRVCGVQRAADMGGVGGRGRGGAGHGRAGLRACLRACLCLVPGDEGARQRGGPNAKRGAGGRVERPSAWVRWTRSGRWAGKDEGWCEEHGEVSSGGRGRRGAWGLGACEMAEASVVRGSPVVKRHGPLGQDATRRSGSGAGPSTGGGDGERDGQLSCSRGLGWRAGGGGRGLSGAL